MSSPYHNYDPKIYNATEAAIKLNEDYFIQIADDSRGYFRILILTSDYNFFGNNWALRLDDTMLVNKTATLNKCFRIYQENSKVGIELFLKALDIDLLEILKRMTTVGFRPNKTKHT